MQRLYWENEDFLVILICHFAQVLKLQLYALWFGKISPSEVKRICFFILAVTGATLDQSHTLNLTESPACVSSKTISWPSWLFCLFSSSYLLAVYCWKFKDK